MKYRRTLLAAGVAGAMAAGTFAMVTMPASAAATGCSVNYTVQSQWPGGFTGNIAITNLGSALTSWSLGFDFSAGQTVTQGWNATFTQSGAHVTATSMSYNGALGTGANIAVGFNGNWTGSNPVPASFTLNGVTCTGSVTTTSPTTGPSRTSSPTSSPSRTPTRSPSTSPTGNPPPSGAPSLHVSGNKLVTSTGATYRLLGVNRSGGEFACIQGRGTWDGPMDQASVTAMRTWKIRAVRVPLNEECWVGTSDVPSGGTTGAAYQQAVKDYVSILLSSGITPILEMHWNYGLYTGPSSGCSDVKATCQKPMPDAQYAPSFWTGVANAFKDNRVVFDLFNEPYPERASGSSETAGWTCWRDGGTCPGITYQVAGFQTLLNAVRATGNTNVVLIGGLAYSNDLTQWLQYKPTDPTGNLAAFAHIYNFNTCSNTSCFDSQLGPVAAQVPLTLSEIGENDCSHGFIDTLMNWGDSHNVGYLGWTWNNWDCSSGPSLISDYNGTATAFGQGLKDHLASVSN
ncbi:cellulose binding domain-containing protein [Rugosimonospora africana]|uniref:Endoglucanase n=1 Tax=Rugosimonospora africana TaxID=556532 RepID=A0A8J3QWD2_9ACTN|nr:cellulose binding domain-containing protein [Rugosimonospora africana]GIH17030.1 endoglucanase [Rugosimonospora africana]